MDVQLSAAQQSLQGMAVGFLHRLPYLVLALAAYLLFHAAARGVRRLIARIARQRRSDDAAGLVAGRLAQAAIIILGLLIALVILIPSFQIGQAVQLLGIGSVAIGFAFRDVLQNFLAGILILFNRPFRVGDQIVVAGYEGTVEGIETRATFIRTYDGRLVVIPNSTVFNGSVTINAANTARRLQYDLRLDAVDDIAAMKARLLEELRTTPSVLNDPAPEVLATDVSGTGAGFRIRWWVRSLRGSDLAERQDEALGAIRRMLDAQRAAAAAAEPAAP